MGKFRQISRVLLPFILVEIGFLALAHIVADCLQTLYMS